MIALCAGWLTKLWYWGVGTFFALLIALAIKPLRVLLILILSVGWAALGYEIGLHFGKQTAVGVVCGVIVFTIALLCHLAAIEWLRDCSGE